MTSETRNIYMVRHLERIDGDDGTRDETKEWNSGNKITYKENPYLIQRPSIQKIIDNLRGKHIDHIVCSPFLRCIQTAILISNSSEVDIANRNIIINFELGELASIDMGLTLPLDLEKIYAQSKDYLSKKGIVTEFPFDESHINPLVFAEDETDDQYNLRILNVMRDMFKKLSGNILFVTHSDAVIPFNNGRRMNYGIIYSIPEEIVGKVEDVDSEESTYERKYLKYKNKYLNLKKMLKF
jgi:hypothetical protein